MNTVINKRIFASAWLYLLVMAILIFYPLLNISPYIGISSKEYINFSPIRPPLYPIFIWLFHGLGAYQFLTVMWAQSLLNFVILLYAAYWLRARLKLSHFLIFVIFLLPVEIFFMRFDLISALRSEALAFPLFIVTFTLLIDCLYRFNKTKLIFLMITGNLLILTREQFYYLYPLFFLLPIQYILRREPFKRVLGALGMILLSILITIFLNNMYHYKVHHHFHNSSAVGFMFITKALYFSTPDDVKYFKDPKEKKLFSQMIEKLQEEHLTYASSPEAPLPLEEASEHYNNNIFHMRDALLNIIPLGETSYQTSALLVKIDETLFLHLLKRNIIFSLWKTADFMGGLYIFLPSLIILISMGAQFILSKDKNPMIEHIFIFVALLTILANALLISVIAHYELRFFYYSYFLYFCLAGLIVNKLTKTIVAE